ncbi:unnamed protein product [Rotaria socialis]|uniref:Uncharacterized protein n=1 Tax=Rotaria socialis TaxID=392032 RepID=A0A818EAG8_9BILA|nr:unnamed protein product [Rotaria socialis]CAF4888788.1 unnamed protein product [Rotaria socialis]
MLNNSDGFSYLRHQLLTTSTDTIQHTIQQPNEKDEKRFINVRLQLLDQQYCLEKDRQLWQSYLDIGLQQHLWPKIIKKLLNHCQFELTKQEQPFQTCPMIELSFEKMEQRLQELVNRERKCLSKRNSDKLIKFKDDISEKQLLTTISASPIMTNQ